MDLSLLTAYLHCKGLVPFFCSDFLFSLLQWYGIMMVFQDTHNINELCIFGFEWHQENFGELQLLSGEEYNSLSTLSSSSLECKPFLLSS